MKRLLMQNIGKWKVKDANFVVKGLSDTSKMPGKSYGIPAKECKIGSILRKKQGSVCESCYAFEKGMYAFNNVIAAQYRRFESLNDPQWVKAMSFLINRQKEPYFRWHDSGDIQNEQHLINIFQVCTNTPKINHWLPTRELVIVKRVLMEYEKPENLCIRISSHFVDHPQTFKIPECQTSTVHKKNKPVGMACNAPSNGNSCGSCRACWNPSIENVSYHKH